MKSFQPREIITYIGYMISYLVVVISFLIFSFSFLNVLFPESSSYSSLGYQDVFGSLGVFTVAVIVFLIMVRTVIRLVQEGATDPESRPRVWVLHGGKFIGWVALAITAAVLVRYFFAGEITIRFLIKIGLVIAVGADAVFFFRHEISRTQNTPRRVSLAASIGAGLVVVVAIIGTFITLGTPQQVRHMRNDEQRVMDLQNLQSQIISWYQSHGTLPENLATLKQVSYATEPRDPEYLKGATYRYRVIDKKDHRYELCGTFATSSHDPLVIRKDRATAGSVYYPVTMSARRVDAPGGDVSTTSLENPWQHDKGDFCFPQTIDTHMYPYLIPQKN
jgi:uncharacterized membrane protein